MVENVPAPRMLHVQWPFGHPYGQPHQPKLQATVLNRLLELAPTAKEFGYLDQPDWLWKRTDVQIPSHWNQVITSSDNKS